jgi:chromosome partitioning protein
MPTIAVLNQKGGSGKTTIATHLSRGFQLDGDSVILVDSDPQGSARDWAAAAAENPVMTVGIDRPTLDRDAKKLPADVVIIDGAPHLENMAVSAIKAADLVLIPVQPSPYDVWATAALVDLVKQRIELTDGALKAAFIVSRAITGTTISKEIFDTLADYDLPVLRTAIHQRIDYPRTAATGATVFDLRHGDGAASAEIRALITEIRAMLASTPGEA